MNANPFFSCDHPQSAILSEWRDVPDMKLLNLVYDLTPIDFVTLVITVPHTFAHLRTFSHIFAHSTSSRLRSPRRQGAASARRSLAGSVSLARREFFARSPQGRDLGGDLAHTVFVALAAPAVDVRTREAVGAPAVCLERRPSEKYSDRGVLSRSGGDGHSDRRGSS